MTKLSAIKEQYEKAVKRLEEVLDQEKNDFMRDSAIQRFEFTFDISWKLLKELLREDHGIECKSPKSCIRESYKQGIIDYEDFWLEMVKMRNETSHLYNEEMADDVYKELPKAIKVFQSLM